LPHIKFFGNSIDFRLGLVYTNNGQGRGTFRALHGRGVSHSAVALQL